MFQKHKVGHRPVVGLLPFYGVPGALIGLFIGVSLRRVRSILLAIGFVLAAYLAFVWFTAPHSFSGCGNECTRWHGRYAEWGFVMLILGANAVGLVVGAAAGTALRDTWTRRRA